MPGYQSSLQKARARELRKSMTKAEKCLWFHLRAHRFLDLSVRRQAPIGPYIVDFLIPAHRLVIEADGGQHADGQDAVRDAFLRSHDYRVLRFWNLDVLTRTEAVLARIAKEVAQ